MRPSPAFLACLLPLAAAAQESTAPAVALPPVTVLGEQDRQDPLAETRPAYAPARAVSATKTDTPRLEVPQGTSVVTAGQIRDQRSSSFADALRYEPGVTGFAAGGVLDNLYVRGFNTDTRIFQDGLLRRFAAGPEPLGLERIEILRGPGSVLYGQAPVGGILAAISKRPTDEPIRELSFGIGTRDFYEAYGDLAGRLDEDGRLLGRVVGVFRRGGTPTRLDGEDRDDRFYLAPSFTYRNPTTRLTILGSWQHDESYSLSNNGLPARGTVLPNRNGEIGRFRNFLEPDSSNVGRFRFDQYRLGWDAEHRFNETFTLRQNAGYFRVTGPGINVLTGALSANERVIQRTAVRGIQDIAATQADTQVEARFSTGPATHTLVSGFDVLRREDTQEGWLGQLAPLDLFAPVYGARPVFGPKAIDQTLELMQYGFYAQDQIRLPGRVTLTGGLRYDRVEAELSNRIRRLRTETSDGAFTGRGGATWEFLPGIALYASYSESFIPQTGTTSTGATVDPERGRQWEGGVKFGLPQDRLTGGAAVFDITRRNVAVSDPANPLFIRPTGEQRSRGFELEAGARPLPGLSLLANYTRLDTEVTQDTNPRLLGTRPVNVPNWQAAAWAVYDFPEDSRLAGLRLGGGIRHVGQRNGDQTAASLTVPAYTVFDAIAEYRTADGWRASLTARNLGDKRFIAIAYSPTAVQYGEPLSVVARLGKAF